VRGETGERGVGRGRRWSASRSWSLGSALLASCTLLFTSCRSAPAPSSVYEPAGETKRNTAQAERLTKEAAEILIEQADDDSTSSEAASAQAEALLRRALAEDLFFGPAHNNLGVVFLKRGDLYAAANEFEWARKLMPGHPDPRLNLAITLDRAGQVDEALSAYTATLEVYPGHIGAIQGLARLAVREGRTRRESGGEGADGARGSGGAGRWDEPRLEEWLRRIAIEGESEAWREWARGRMAR